MATLPRGVQQVQWTNTDGSITTKYRVRISRKDFKGKRNNYFTDLKEAVSFLKLSKLEKGKELIYSITEEERKKQITKRSNIKDYTFGSFANLYYHDYVLNREDEQELLSKVPELKKRNIAMKRAFLTTICSISIIDRYTTYEDRQNMGIDDEDQTLYRYFGKLDVRTEIKPIDIDNYIRERLKKIKPVSVSRELTFISNVFNKLRYFDESLEKIDNPVRKYDKTLLQNIINIRKRILTDEEEAKFIDVISSYSNKQLADICTLSLLTSMRRSEIIFLTTDQIKDDFKFIHLPITKSGRSRDVYLDETAREFLKNLQPAPNAKNNRYFTYTCMGFGRVFSGLMKNNGFQDLHFHDLRRTKISKMLSLGGNDNTILIAKLLGFSSVRKFEEIHVQDKHVGLSTQSSMLSSIGHKNIDVNYKHYFNPVMTEVHKLSIVKQLREKKKTTQLTDEEEKQLLKLLLELTE